MKAAQVLHALLGNPAGIIVAGLALWGLDWLTGVPIFLALLVLTILGLVLAAFLRWRAER